MFVWLYHRMPQIKQTLQEGIAIRCREAAGVRKTWRRGRVRSEEGRRSGAVTGKHRLNWQETLIADP